MAVGQHIARISRQYVRTGEFRLVFGKALTKVKAVVTGDSMRLTYICAGLAASFAWGGKASYVSASDLVSHHAIYSITLESTVESSGGPASIRGAMSYEFQSRCNAWTVDSTVFLKMRFDGPREIESVRKIITWEGKDGLGFRFRLSETHGGENVEEINGVAALDGKGQAGIVEYVKPRRFKVNLPKGTLFPTGHVKAVISTSVLGGNFVGRHLFDGALLDEPYMVSAFIAKKAEQSSPANPAKGEPEDLATWNARLAYFGANSPSETPEFEIGVRYRENGIVEELIQDYGTYTIVARLDQLEIMPFERC